MPTEVVFHCYKWVVVSVLGSRKAARFVEKKTGFKFQFDAATH